MTVHALWSWDARNGSWLVIHYGSESEMHALLDRRVAAAATFSIPSAHYRVSPTDSPPALPEGYE